MTTTANVFSNNTRINNFFVENLDDKHEYDSFEEWYGEFCLLIDAYQLVIEDDKNFETMSFMGKVDVHEELKEKYASSDDESSDDESSDDESSDDESSDDEEYEFYDYGRKDGEIIVAGGGLANGNAYATVKQLDNGYIRYHEYGKYACSRMYRNHYIDWNDNEFNIKEKYASSDDDKQDASIVIQSFLRGSKVRCGNERWMLMLWKVKRFISKNGRLPSS